MMFVEMHCDVCPRSFQQNYEREYRNMKSFSEDAKGWLLCTFLRDDVHSC